MITKSHAEEPCFASLLLSRTGLEYPMREADKEGEAGRAWLIPATRPEQAASVGTWLVNVPGAHQFWEWWVVAVVHLREGVSLPPPKRIYEGAEYEFTILTVDSDECPNPDPELADEEGLLFYTPPDVVEQFHGVEDSAAARIAALAVDEILGGKISPDSEYRPKWKTLIDDTVKAFQAGHHVLN